MAAEAAARWRADPYPYLAARSLVADLGVSEPVAVTLVRRGYATAAEARRFLAAAESHDPFCFEGMASIADCILGAIASGKRITVHGDYDVDGVCSTAILVSALRELGASCDWHLPSRFEEGYGLSLETVELLARRGTELLVTVDCGITAVEEVAAATRRGLEVIVTDHHRPGSRLPDCPLLHPELSGYPCPELCATGVAYKLSAALRQTAGLDPAEADRDLDLVALATVADLVPLRGENRALVRRGIAAARRTRRPGLRALLASSRTSQADLDESDLAFRLAPRINAAGRLYRADAGVELWLTQDEARAAAIAEELDSANRERRDTELHVLHAAEAARASLPAQLTDAAALVLAGEGWHPGVAGIVATRLVERHHRPVVLIALDGHSGRGSGRSIAGFDLLAGLEAASEHLLRFGGHRAAAGLEIEAAAVESFRDAFVAHASSLLSPEDLAPIQAVDALVGAERLGLGLAEELAQLGPFGMGNRGPVLLVPAAEVTDVRTMGEGKHVRFSLRSGASRAQAVGFGIAKLGVGEGEPQDASVRLEANEWNGAIEPRAVLKHLHPVSSQPACASPCASCPERALGREWWLRVEAARREDLDEWPPRTIRARLEAQGTPRREAIQRRGSSPVAAIGELVSSGEAVLALCADVSRRRALAEQAAQPLRFGFGSAVLASGRCAQGPMNKRLRRHAASSGGLVLADYETLARTPDLTDRFEHVVLVDPPAFPHLGGLAALGRPAPWAAGFLHLAHGPAEADFALNVHRWAYELEGPLREIYVALRDAPADADQVALLAGPSSHPRSPEQAGRCLRVLEELGLLVEDETGPAPRLRALSSISTDLGRSRAFRAYGARLEEGTACLTQQRQRP